jgi:hypothetical protein
MKRRHKKRAKNARVIRLWSLQEVGKAVPYLHSVIGSIRENWLDVQSLKREAVLVEKRIPAGTKRLVALSRAKDDIDKAENRFAEAIEELSRVDVFLLDPVRGMAFIAFRQGEELAWFIFDQFEEKGLIGWRLHSDALEMCRPLNLLAEPTPLAAETPSAPSDTATR